MASIVRRQSLEIIEHVAGSTGSFASSCGVDWTRGRLALVSALEVILRDTPSRTTFATCLDQAAAFLPLGCSLAARWWTRLWWNNRFQKHRIIMLTAETLIRQIIDRHIQRILHGHCVLASTQYNRLRATQDIIKASVAITTNASSWYIYFVSP